MPTLDEKIKRSIDSRFEEFGLLFNDADGDAGDILGLLRTIADQVPLLEDIKTEVKQLQNNQIPESEEKDQEPEDDPRNDPSPSDPEVQGLRKALRDAIKGLDKAKRLTSPLRKALPSPEDPIPDWVKDVPWYDMASDVYKIFQIFKMMKDMEEKYDTSFTHLKQMMDGEKTFQEVWQEEEKALLEALDRAIDIMNTDLEDELVRMFQLGQNVKDSLTLCCQNMTDDFGNVNDKLDDLDQGLPDPGQIDELSDRLLNSTSDLVNQMNGLRGLV